MEEFENHQHCIICSGYRKIENNDYINTYICENCKKSFPKFYLLYRKIIDRTNFKKNYDKENLLELRLTRGDIYLEERKENK